VQFDQSRYLVDVLVREAQGLHALARHPRPDDLMVMEGHPAVALEPASPGLADVMQEGRQAQGQVRTACGLVRVLEDDRLLQHRQGVLVDVLVMMMLICLQSQQGQFREDVVGKAGIDEHGETSPWVSCHHDLGELIPDSLSGDDLQPVAHRTHGCKAGRLHLEPQLRGEPGGSKHPQRIVPEGVLGRARGADHARLQVG